MERIGQGPDKEEQLKVVYHDAVLAYGDGDDAVVGDGDGHGDIYAGCDDDDGEEHYQGQDEGETGGRGRPRKNGVSSGGVAQFIRGLFSITLMLIVIIFTTFTF